MGVAEVVAVLRADTSEFTARMGEAEAQVTKLTNTGASNFEKMAAVGKVAMLATGAAVVGVGIIAVDLGNKAEDAQAQMVNAFKNAGTSTTAYSGQIAAVDAQLTKYGYSNTTTNEAIARLVTVTGNAKTALNDMGLAADIARNRHIDLSSATDLLAKTMAGNVIAAKRMGIEIPPEILKIKDPLTKANDITAILEERFKGSASAAAGTFSGRMETLKAQGENLAANIGQKLIPILEKLVTQITQVVNWFEKHKAVAEALGVAIGTLVSVAIAAYIASMVSAAAATIAATWPILLIIAAVALVGVAIYEFATHWKQIWNDIKTWVAEGAAWVRDHFYIIMTIPIVGWMIELAANWRGIWEIIKTVISTAWSYIQPIFNFIKTLGTDYIIANIQLLQGIWNTAWTVISTAVSVAWTVIKGVWDLIKAGINDVQTVVNALSTAWSTVWNGLGSLVSAAWNNVIKPAIQPILDGISAVSSAWDSVFGGGSSSKASTVSAAASAAAAPIKKNAMGGPLGAGQVSLVGEMGPELFVPSSSGTIIPNNALGGGGSVTVPITLTLDGQVIANTVQTVLLQKNRSVPTLGFS